MISSSKNQVVVPPLSSTTTPIPVPSVKDLLAMGGLGAGVDTTKSVALVVFAPPAEEIKKQIDRVKKGAAGDEIGMDDLQGEDRSVTLVPVSNYGEFVASLLAIAPEQRLQGRSQATVQNYRQMLESVEGILSSHHAQSRLDDPLASRLVLADGEITLGQLLTPGWRFPQLDDIFLSCCETGLGQIDSSEDVLTLATGFLCAGARTVISTFWSVDDLASMVFSVFYHQARFNPQTQQIQDRITAFHQAQQQLRSLTCGQMQAFLQPWGRQLETQRQQARKQAKQHPAESEAALVWQQQQQRYQQLISLIVDAEDLLEKSPAAAPLFAHPIHWAAFKCEGLR